MLYRTPCAKNILRVQVERIFLTKQKYKIMSKLITKVLTDKSARDQQAINAFAAQLAEVGAPWAE